MIIVDGPDGAGKTTLCEMLLKHKIVDKVLPSPRIVSGPNPEKFKHETDRYIRVYGGNQRVAVDRLLFSEMAYGPVFRSAPVFTRNEYLTKLLEILLSGSIVVFCLPDELNFKKDESSWLLDKMPQVLHNYKAIVEDSAFANPKTYIYKWNELRAFDKLTQFIKENR
jgi:hypothetical protein